MNDDNAEQDVAPADDGDSILDLKEEEN